MLSPEDCEEVDCSTGSGTAGAWDDMGGGGGLCACWANELKLGSNVCNRLVTSSVTRDTSWSITGEGKAAGWSVPGAAGGCGVEDDELPSTSKLCLLTHCGGEETKASKAWADGRLDHCERRGGINRKQGNNNKYLELTPKIQNTVNNIFSNRHGWHSVAARARDQSNKGSNSK